MQITVKATKIGKTGTSDKGDWELIVVTSDDGTDYTTFHKGAKNLTAGSVVEFEPIIKDGKCSFKEYMVVSAAPISSGNGQPGMTPELWAEKDRLERWSRECNTCFMGVADLLKVDSEFAEGGKTAVVYDAALDWALAHFTGSDAVPEKKQSATPKAPQGDKMPVPATFKDVGEFLTIVNHNLGFNRSQVCEYISVQDPKDIIDFNEAYATLEKVGKK